MDKNTRRELSVVEKGMVIALFLFFARLVSLQAALGRLLKTSFSRPQNAVMSRTSLDLEGPRSLANANGGPSGERLSVYESLPESNCVMSVHLMCR